MHVTLPLQSSNRRHDRTTHRTQVIKRLLEPACKDESIATIRNPNKLVVVELRLGTLLGEEVRGTRKVLS